MTLITTESEIELAAMEIADRNYWQAQQIKRQWLSASYYLLIATLESSALRVAIFRARQFAFAVK